MDCDLLKSDISWNITDTALHTHLEASFPQLIPTALFVLGTPLRVFQFDQRSTHSPMYYFKFITVILTASMTLYSIGQSIHDIVRGQTIQHEKSLGAVVILSTMLMEVYKSRKQNYMIFNNRTLSIAWLFIVVGVLITNQGGVLFEVGGDNAIQQLIFVLYVILVIVRLIETWCVDRSGDEIAQEVLKQDVSPESTASFLSWLTFSWMTPLIHKGYKQTLERTDLYPLSQENTSSTVIPHFDENWKIEEDRAKRKKRSLEQRSTRLDSKDRTVQPPQASLLYCLCRTYTSILLLSALFQLSFNLTEFVCPFVIKWLIANTRETSEHSWKGYMYAVLMFALTVLKAFFIQHHVHLTQTAGRRSWISLTSAIYKKTLRLSNASKNSTTVGEIINLMSNDARKIAECMWSVNDVWAVPLVFFLAFFVLWQTLGAAAFVGIVVILAFAPINVVLMKKSTTLHHENVDLTDARIKTMNEVLNGIKVLKMYAWEEPFEKRILEIRDKELEVKLRRKTIETWLHLIWATSPFMVSLSTFAAYVLMDSNNVLTAEKAFVALSLFHRIHWALHILPHVINNFIQAKVSLGRIQSFLHSEELDDDILSRHEEHSYGVYVEEGTFYWDMKEEPILKDINIKIPEGSLVAIVGAVGAGKSSLLSAILGEMESKSKQISIKGSIAYVAQEAWIMNTTLQNNILFGQELIDNKYEETIDAAALRKDLEILSGGDQTEIGEKGINLSGGQKQRVSLARAIYQDADVYLLDDPLSAVDSHVGKHIFDNVIGSNGLLRNKTRILVTHGISFLPKVDLIITLVDGKMKEMGSFKELVEQNGAFAEFLKNYLLEELNCGDSEEINKALETTEEVAFQIADTGSAGILRRQLSEIATRTRTESEMSGTFQNIKTNCPSYSCESCDHHLEQVGPQTNIVGQPSQKTEVQTFRSSFELDLCASSEHVDHLTTIDYHLDRRIDTDDDVFDCDRLFARQLSSTSNTSSNCKDLNPFSRQTSKSSTFDNDAGSTKYSRITEDETTQVGTVKLSVVMMYGGAVGLNMCIIILSMNMIHKVAEVYLDVWVGNWASDYTTLTNGTMDNAQTHMRLTVYAIIGFIRGILIFMTEICVTRALVKASKKIHYDLLHNILRSPMSFFDTTPIGRIVNRFSTDIDTLDDQIIYQFKDSYISVICLMCNLFVICTGTPQAIFIIIPIAMSYFYIQRIFASASRQLRRLESAAKSPIFSHFGETLSGCSTIRAYQQQNRFISESAHRCNEVNTIHLLKVAARRWLSIRMEALGSLIVLFVCLLVVFGKEYLSPSLVGLCITNAINVTGCLEWLVRITSDLESNIVSVERIKEYSETPTEAARVIEDSRPKNSWPDKGCVEIKDYAVRYRDGLDLVLKGITCNIQQGQKIGIVGRTGAGKSSLTMGLFRLIERAKGSMVIDGIDISTIGLRDLRSKITIIPQDPILFSGTMKMNLDPFEEYSDKDIWKALEHAHLQTFVKGLSGELEFMCSEGGENLSVGQRQLICLARALLRKTKILVLDEATAAVDLETDDLIQKTIRAEFAACTTLTIAHRLNTILDYDRIMVLDSGNISEFDTPSNLLNDNSSVFYGMAKDAGLVA